MFIGTAAGRAGSTPVVRKLKSGESVANFSVAVDRFKKKDDGDNGPIWVKVTLWGKQADVLSPYITKGKQLVVSGDVDIQSYETKDGETRTEITLRANKVTLMGGGETRDESQDATEQEESTEVSDEDIPF